MFFSKKLNKFKKIKHCFFSKNGGFSKGLYKSLNCVRALGITRRIFRKTSNMLQKKFYVKKKTSF